MLKFWTLQNNRKISNFLVQRAVILFIITVILTVLSIYGALHLKIDNDYMAFLPETFPGVVNLKKVIEKTGGFGNFMVVLEGATPQIRRDFAKKFSLKARKLNWVDYVEYKKDWEKIENNKFLYLSIEDLEAIYERLERTILFKKNPLAISLFNKKDEEMTGLDFTDIERKYQRTSFGSPYFEDPENKYTIAIIWPSGSMTDIALAQRAHSELEKIVDDLNPKSFDSNLGVIIGGEFRTKIDEYNSIVHNIKRSALLTILGISLLLFLFYRRFNAIFFILFPLIIGIVLSFGLANLLVGRLNLLTVFLITILFGVGVDYGIYLFSRYTEERSRGQSLEESIAIVLFGTGKALTSAAFSTALAFFLLIFTDFKGFQEFGLLASVGVCVIFITFVILSPVLWILGERFGILVVREKLKTRQWIKNTPLSRGFVLGGLIISILACCTIPFSQFEYDYGKLRSRTSTYWRVKSIIHEVFPLSKTPAVVITDSLEETRQLVQVIKDKIPKVKTIDTVKSILDFLPEGIDQKKVLLSNIRNLILKNKKLLSLKEKETVDKYFPYLNPGNIKLEDLPRGLLRSFKGLPNSEGFLVFIYDKVALSNLENATQYGNDIREFKIGSKAYYPAEGSMLFADALNLMKKEAKLTVWVMMLMMFLLVALTFWSFKKSLIVLVPLSVGLLLTLGVMFVVGLKFNIFNLVIFPILIGVGIDGGILLYSRYLEEKEPCAMTKMVQTTGNSLLLAALTAMVGFGSLLNSDHRGLQSIGTVAVVGLTCILISNLFFFPSFLKWIQDRVRSPSKD